MSHSFLHHDCNVAVRLQLVAQPVKREDRRAARARETEERILSAARRMFLERGYAGTTLADVAEAAEVAARTVYVRFGTKAALLKRVVDVALVGDTAPIDVVNREWFQTALTAPTLEQRIAAQAGGAARLMAAAADVIAVAVEAAADEPALAAANQAGREATRKAIRQFWTRARRDGLLPANCDLDWLADTTGLLMHADTYRLMRATLHWSPARYERWLVTTLHRAVAASAL
jgi:AcrR family transcriptional regulator